MMECFRSHGFQTGAWLAAGAVAIRANPKTVLKVATASFIFSCADAALKNTRVNTNAYEAVISLKNKVVSCIYLDERGTFSKLMTKCVNLGFIATNTSSAQMAVKPKGVEKQSILSNVVVPVIYSLGLAVFKYPVCGIMAGVKLGGLVFSELAHLSGKAPENRGRVRYTPDSKAD